MSSEGRKANDGASAFSHPSLWLIAPTLSLLLGQAIAASSWVIPAQAGILVLTPLLFLPSIRIRRVGLLLLITAVAFSVGYARHRQLLQPSFPANHLRSVMDDSSRLYLEGTLEQEPEKLPNRSRWIVRAERIWHKCPPQLFGR